MKLSSRRNKLIYNNEFYNDQCNNNISSAKVIVPIVKELLLLAYDNPNNLSVIDLGCGTGNWLSVFKEYGFAVKGVDGGDIPSSLMMILPEEFRKHDLRERYKDGNRYSLAMSLECAEHLPESVADDFVCSLIELSDIVMFSAAIPFQRGDGHINEQWQSYWVEKFKKYEYLPIDYIRHCVWNNEMVQPFYAQNLFVFVKNNGDYRHVIKKYQSSGLQNVDLVHPAYWSKVCNNLAVKCIFRIFDLKPISWIYYKLKKNTGMR